MRSILAALITAVAIPLLGGCGQTGPLYLPEEDVPRVEPAEPAQISEQQT